MVQMSTLNNLFAHHYTVYYNYCSEAGLPTTAPFWEEISATFNASFIPIREEVEAACKSITGKSTYQQSRQVNDAGKAILAAPSIHPTPAARSTNGAASRSRLGSVCSAPRRSSLNQVQPAASASPAQPQSFRQSSAHSIPPAAFALPESPCPSSTPSPRSGTPCRDPQTGEGNPWRCSTPSSLSSSRRSSYVVPTPLVSASPFSPSERRPSIPSTASSSGSDKKRKPPPPPPKREWVIALYDFEDLNEGDLQFREGDRIKVIRKTDSMVD